MLFVPPILPVLTTKMPCEMRKFYDVLVKDAVILAFLDMVAFAEGTDSDDGYRKRYGTSKTIKDLSQHPAHVFCRMASGKVLCSSAAGRYQFITETWNYLVYKLHLPDFSPESQDIGAICLLHECGALKQLERGSISGAIKAASKVWASLPWSQYGQPVKSYDECVAVFSKRYVYHNAKNTENWSKV